MNIPPRLAASYSTISANELLKHVVSDYPIEEPHQCLFWTRGANDTYEVRCIDARYSLRVYRCGAYPREAIEFEAEALNYLHQQRCPVAYPIARHSGEFVYEISAPEGPRFILLTAFAEGSAPNYDSLENCRVVGESVAQLHEASIGFETTLKRTRLDLQSLLEDSMATIRPHIEHRPNDLGFVEKLAQDARAAVQAVPEELLEIGICHGDLHGGNLHIHEGKVTHFDFEECAFGYSVYDLATFKWGVCMGKRQANRWPAFVEGYESVRPIAKPERSLIDTFVIIRDLSNIAYSMRNLQDFGHELTSEGEIDDLCKGLENILESVRMKSLISQ